MASFLMYWDKTDFIPSLFSLGTIYMTADCSSYLKLFYLFDFDTVLNGFLSRDLILHPSNQRDLHERYRTTCASCLNQMFSVPLLFTSNFQILNFCMLFAHRLWSIIKRHVNLISIRESFRDVSFSIVPSWSFLCFMPLKGGPYKVLVQDSPTLSHEMTGECLTLHE